MRIPGLHVPVALLLAGLAAAFPAGAADMSFVWAKTMVLVPGEPYLKTVETWPAGEFQALFPESEKLPTLIFLHGCNGFSLRFRQADYPRAAVRADFAVFIPDSFARPGRKQYCGGVPPDVIATRHAEIDEVYRRVLEIPWVDKSNIFLGGHSEGALTTALYPGGQFNAYFIMGWTCTSATRAYDGIAIPRGRPVLSIVGTEDDYYKGRANQGRCSVAGRPGGSQSIVLDGVGHEVNDHPDTIPTVMAFLKGNLKR